MLSGTPSGPVRARSRAPYHPFRRLPTRLHTVSAPVVSPARPFAERTPHPTPAVRRVSCGRRIESRAMKIAVCVKAVPDAATGRRLDPSSKRLDRTGELDALRLRHAAGRRGAEAQGGRGRRRGRRRLDGPGTRAGRAAQGARDGRRPRGARLRRGARGRRPRRDVEGARGSARARGGRPRPVRSAVGRRRRRLPLGRRRRAAAPADDLAGLRAVGRGRRGHGQAPDGVRLRHDPRAAARRSSPSRTRSTCRATRR